MQEHTTHNTIKFLHTSQFYSSGRAPLLRSSPSLVHRRSNAICSRRYNTSSSVMSSPQTPSSSSPIVRLNVGGRKYYTTQSTLCDHGENFFTALLGGNFSSVRDEVCACVWCMYVCMWYVYVCAWSDEHCRGALCAWMC